MPQGTADEPADKQTLNEYLHSVDVDCEKMFSRLVKQYAEREGVTEQMKAYEMMKWGASRRWRPLPQAEAPTEPAGETGLMNNIRSRAEEVVMREYIYEED